MPSKCKGDDCKKSASYGIVGGKRTHCASHKTDDMILLKIDSRICQHEDHENDEKPPRASFGLPGEKATMCKKHATDDMKNVNVEKYAGSLCEKCKKKQPSFGKPGEKATRCADCKEKDMVDLRSNTCEKCYTNATYGFIGDKKATRCKAHAEKGMEDIKNAKCIECVKQKLKKSKQPAFGIEKPTHCFEHKTSEMKDLRHKNELCVECETRATFGYGTATHCGEHKNDDMKDLSSKMCQECGETQATFGINKGEPTHCKACKDDEMVRVKGPMCEVCGLHQPVFNIKGEKKGIRCGSCKTNNMVDVVNPRCKSCELFLVTRKGMLCSYCRPMSGRYQRTKEMAVVNFLKEHDIEFEHNKSTGFVCGNYRPDIKIDMGTHIIIVEVDEGQHKQYYESCEVSRMLNIHTSEGLRCVFIRFNPDNFRIKNKPTEVSMEDRYALLLDTIKEHQETVPDCELSVHRLFYDNDKKKYAVKYDIDDAIKRLIFNGEFKVTTE